MNLAKLRELNFKELITIDVPDIRSYTFNEYRARNYEHPVTGYCVSCEKLKCNHAIDDDTYKLTNISHGSHASDFLLSLKEKPNILSWHNEPIMFIYEAPSLDYEIYKQIKFNDFEKRPTKEWYWIHKDHELMFFPDYFKGRVYGEFVLSLILTFKLSNLYMTN